jgi:organic hydroperoxide reductase OsmC/OhrA
MPDDIRPLRITEIVLRPRITVRGDVSEARVHHLCEVVHRECYIANSVTTDIRVEPAITIVDG